MKRRPASLHSSKRQCFTGKTCCRLMHATVVSLILIVLTWSTQLLPTPFEDNRLELSEIKESFYLERSHTNFRGGLAYKVPPSWDRFLTPWFRPPVRTLLAPKESRYRYLYSPTRIMTSDGIGHSLGVINFEYNMALRLNLTYTHRVGFYSSLSMRNRYAVEEFFGWGYNEVQRNELQQEGCEPLNETWPADDNLYSCHFCGKPRKHGKMKIKQVVSLPSAFGQFSCHDRTCRETQRSFVRNHYQSHTIFQLHGHSCKPPSTDSNMLETKSLFYHKYWNRHGRLLWSDAVIPARDSSTISFDPGYLNIAIHVRRGDFLEEETQKKRKLTKDRVFAEVLKSAISIVHRGKDPFANMPTAIHIYSEGRLLKDKVFSTHDVGVQDQSYYDSDGVQRDGNWWKEMISRSFRSGSTKMLGKTIQRTKVHMHISENTVDSLHEMIAADIFIGSASGLSTNLVWSISRGVVLIPHHGTIDNERGKKGDICCSVPFENKSGRFSDDLFESYWKAYVAANGESAARSLLDAQRITKQSNP